MRVLVVEDEQKVAEALREGFEGERYDVVVERTGESAFFRVNTETFDVILLDLMLPGRDGRTLLKEMRTEPALAEIPVVVMTGTASEEQALGHEHLDVQGFLAKPVDLDKFLSVVERLKDYWKTDMILPMSEGRPGV